MGDEDDMCNACLKHIVCMYIYVCRFVKMF